jgi:predicted peptidase
MVLAQTRPSQQAGFFEHPGERGGRMGYLLFLPRGYRKDSERRWPLILFLHGAGETGEDPWDVVRTGVPALAEELDLPFVVLSPQCPKRSSWHLQTDLLLPLLGTIMEGTRIDPSRVYLTGISMGGAGAWIMGSRSPELFAAVAPICGYGPDYLGFPERVCTLKDTPVWVFHGARDEVVPPLHSRVLVDTLRECGGRVRFTVYPEEGHDSWTRTYRNPELYDWFLRQEARETVP